MLPPPSLSLFLKVTFSILTGAATLLSFSRHRRHHLLSSLRLLLFSSLQRNPNVTVRTPSILVAGLRSHGKSALINTFCHVLANERGPLIVRSETAPVGPPRGACRLLEGHTVMADVVVEEDGRDVEGAVEFVEGTGSTGDVALPGTDGGDMATVDCVVVVVRCGVRGREREVAGRWVGEVANQIRERGLHLVVVLTRKNELKSTKQAERLRREVACRARTDCVYFIENYTQNFRHPAAIKDDFDTQVTVLMIVRQCLEFARLHRSRSSSGRDAVMSRPAINMP